MLRNSQLMSAVHVAIMLFMTASERIVTEALTLSEQDRLEIIEQLWDSLGLSTDDLDLTNEQKVILDSRIAELEVDPHSGIPWSKVKADRGTRQ